MKLSQQAIQDFKAIFKEVFTEEISDEYARDRAESLMRLMLIVLRRQPWDEDDKIGKKIKARCVCEPHHFYVSQFSTT